MCFTSKKKSKWSGPQYRLWARAMVSGVHDSDKQPTNSPHSLEGFKKKSEESLADAFAMAATAIANT